MRTFLNPVGVGLFACAAAVGCKGDMDGQASATETDTTATTEVAPATTGGTPTTTEGTSTGGTTGEPFLGVRQSTLGTYLPRAGGMLEASLDPLADGAELSITADDQTYPGVYDGAAWIEFADVPEGPYRWRRNNVPDPNLPGTRGLQQFRDTELRDLDVGQIFSGRPDVALAASDATAIAISATGMTALTIYDSFELYSYNVDAIDFPAPSYDPDDGTQSPIEGATELAAWTLPWTAFSSRGDRPLVDPGQDDDLWITHLTGQPLVPMPTDEQLQDAWTYATIGSLREAAQLDLAAMVDGQTNPATGAFAGVAQSSIDLDLRTSKILGLLTANMGAPGFVLCSASVYFEPGVDAPIYGNVPTLGLVSVESVDVPVDPLCPPDSCDPNQCMNGCTSNFVIPGDRVLTLDYGNPFPGGTESVSVSCSAFTFVTHPTADTSETLTADLSFSGTLADLAAGALTPRLGLVQDIRLGGAPLAVTDVITGAGTTPTISFTPPALGDPDYYIITVRTLENVVDDQDNILSSRRNVATISTTATTVTLPDGILEPGAYYYVQVRASRGFMLGAGRAYQHDQDNARAASGMFTP